LASEDLPAWIAPSNACAGIGSRPDAAMAPSITALIMAPASLATASMSNSTCARAFFSTDSVSLAASKRPSPIAIFSAMAWERCMLAIIRVRSGVTKPPAMVRPASSNSLATTMSTSPMPGASASTGRLPPSSRHVLGNNSM
jgi:hypothetical protein